MSNTNLQFLSNISDVLTRDVDTLGLSTDLKTAFNKYVGLKDLRLYVYDHITSTMRDCLDSWCIIEEDENLYKAFEDIKEHDFIINSKAYKLPATMSDITLKINSLYMPIVKEEKVLGLLNLCLKKTHLLIWNFCSL